ncbi:superfamily I DNA/RNA helicase [Bacillus pumilus]|uniref:UvrD-helicase domain-containing protein n=1 Tax=Bacillus pumilus TaxID=1408 RepID=UPI0028587FE3|nr:UvrD-helicase domain-containing protein [Bacillus pumilus]MDR6749333.1 superfamily I DNA/RNA helicase [Bacillus pumilus]
MKIVVAGAGAGKTTSMAQQVLKRYTEVKDEKIIYVITYTNAARDKIREKIIELHGIIPKQIKVETSHAFLLREIIFPFHHLLYGNQYILVSQMKLSDNHIFKARKIRELQNNKIIHVEKVTETAKWIICGKARDLKSVKVKRKTLLAIIKRYMDSVFIDEAQDMDDKLAEIIRVFDNNEINLYIVGDPKQDLRGRNAFRRIIEEYNQKVEYKVENYRCPISHVNFANNYIPLVERQIPQKLEQGKIEFILESKIKVNEFIQNSSWDYIFIINKTEKFITSSSRGIDAKHNLKYELRELIKKSNKYNEKEIEITLYKVFKDILKIINTKENIQILCTLEEILSIKMSKQDRGKLSESLNYIRNVEEYQGIIVNSIDNIKGLDGENCLFILTTSLAPYLFREKVEQNKMLNYLYVALTRAKNKLVILITYEVEEQYGIEFIKNKFKEFLKI